VDGFESWCPEEGRDELAVRRYWWTLKPPVMLPTSYADAVEI
jgi:hypothetical protein